MNIARLENATYKDAYGILCSPLAGPNSREGLYPTFCRVPRAGRTTAHSHFEPEVFFIIAGTGSVAVATERTPVGPGDLVRIPPFARHELENTGASELVFLSVYGEDFEVPRLPESTLITTAPPTPNGPLHLGHLSGPYLAGDVLARALRARSARVRTHSGTDDHQNYVTEAARRRGEEPTAFRTAMRTRISRGLVNAGIGYDEFIEPRSDAGYRAGIKAFAARARAAGLITAETRELPHCESCDLFLIDALVSGSCPECGEASAGGCESCGIVVPAWQLVNPTCTRCHTPAGRREASVHVFALERHLPAIREDLKRLALPPRLRALVDKICAKDQHTMLVAHPPTGASAIRLADTTQVLHVWFEMAAAYERFALAPETWVHCFGFDNAFHYLLFIPALLRALDPQAKLPDHVITNEFLLLDGQKFSTSRGHAIWADEPLEDAEAMRLYLALIRPDRAQADFTKSRFVDFAQDLRKQLVALTAENLAATAPADAAALTACNRFTRELERTLSPQSFDMRQSVRLILAFLDSALHDAPPARRLKARVLAAALEPFMPEEAARLRRELGVAAPEWHSDWTALS